MKPAAEVENVNHLVWEGAKGHYEVYYLTFNHTESKTGFWIRYTMNAPEEGQGAPYAQVWFSYFNREDPEANFALKKKYPIDALKGEKNPFSVRIGDCELSNGRAAGSIEGNGHAASWELSFIPSTTVHYHLPKIFYKKKLGDTTALCPNLDIKLDGKIEIDGKTLIFKEEPGDQTHLWGEKHAERWAWVHCNSFEEDSTAVIEGLAVQLKRFGMKIPLLHIMFIRRAGQDFNFIEPLGILTTTGNFRLGHWRFKAYGIEMKFEGQITCRPADLVCAEYKDPDGEEAFCHNTEVADCEIKVYKRKSIFSKWELEDSLSSTGTTHVEFSGRTRDSRVTKTIVEV